MVWVSVCNCLRLHTTIIYRMLNSKCKSHLDIPLIRINCRRVRQQSDIPRPIPSVCLMRYKLFTSNSTVVGSSTCSAACVRPVVLVTGHIGLQTTTLLLFHTVDIRPDPDVLEFHKLRLKRARCQRNADVAKVCIWVNNPSRRYGYCRIWFPGPEQ